jgi:hypothetical protein
MTIRIAADIDASTHADPTVRAWSWGHSTTTGHWCVACAGPVNYYRRQRIYDRSATPRCGRHLRVDLMTPSGARMLDITIEGVVYQPNDGALVYLDTQRRYWHCPDGQALDRWDRCNSIEPSLADSRLGTTGELDPTCDPLVVLLAELDGCDANVLAFAQKLPVRLV